jgi:hypothetical protein
MRPAPNVANLREVIAMIILITWLGIKALVVVNDQIAPSDG